MKAPNEHPCSFKADSIVFYLDFQLYFVKKHLKKTTKPFSPSNFVDLIFFSIFGGGHTEMLMEGAAEVGIGFKAAGIGDRPDFEVSLGEELFGAAEAEGEDVLFRGDAHPSAEEAAEIDLADLAFLRKRLVGDSREGFALVEQSERGAEEIGGIPLGEGIEHFVEEGEHTCAATARGGELFDLLEALDEVIGIAHLQRDHAIAERLGGIEIDDGEAARGISTDGVALPLREDDGVRAVLDAVRAVLGVGNAPAVGAERQPVGASVFHFGVASLWRVDRYHLTDLRHRHVLQIHSGILLDFFFIVSLFIASCQ